MKMMRLFCGCLCMVVLFCGCQKPVASGGPQGGGVLGKGVETLLAEADAAMESADYATAAELYEAVLRQEEDHIEAQQGYGKALLLSGNFALASKQLARAHALAPDDTETTLALAAAHIGSGAYIEAEALLMPLWEDTPPLWQAGVLLVQSYVAQGRFEDAQRLLDNEELNSYLQGISGEDSLLLDALGAEAAGREDNREDTVLYEGGVYTGSYEDGLRSGWGVWVYGLFRYEGYWENDMPNGEGTLYEVNFPPEVKEPDKTYALEVILAGFFVDGFPDGDITYTWHMDNGNTHIWQFAVVYGIPGEGVVGECVDCGATLTTHDDSLYGVPPWADVE